MALLVSQTIWEFSPSDHEAVQPCVLCSYSIIPNSRTNRWPVKAQLLSSLSTKFIVMDPLGLDPTHPWAQSENCDPTIGAVCGKSCLYDDECNGLLRQDQVPWGGYGGQSTVP